MTPWTVAHQASLSITKSWSLLKLMSIELVIPSKHLILCHPGGLPWTLPSLGSQSLLSFGWLSSSQCLIHLLTYLRMHVLPWQHSGVRSPWDWILALPFTTCMTLRSWSKPFCLFFSFNPQNGDDNVRVKRLHFTFQVKNLEHCLVHSEGFVSIHL